MPPKIQMPLFCCFAVGTTSSSTTDDPSLVPRIAPREREMPPKKAKTYGKKKAPTSSSSSIFAAPSPTPGRLTRREATAIIEPNEEATILTPSSPQHSPPSSNSHSQGVVVSEVENETLLLSRLNLNDDNSLRVVEETTTEDSDFVDPALGPLNQLFSREQFEFCNSTWAELLPGGDITVVKIAEASFAEVYRVETNQGSSIVKIMPLMVPSDLESYERTNASKAEDVVPELQIMDELTEIPGFVKFKKAWLVKGKQSEKFVEAWEKFQSVVEEPSEFAHPASYGPNATFLAIELDDAGEVLENFLVDSWDKFWQIFLGVVQALATAEQVNDFEHRDLHENNICVLRNTTSSPNGLDITLIDYGLSRAKFKIKNTNTTIPEDDLEEGKSFNDQQLEGRVAFKDLEQDLEIFQGPKGQLQFETYRQMRVYLYNGTTKKMPMKFHKDSTLMTEAGKSWEEFTPYTNVLWLAYIFQYLSDQYKESMNTSSSSILPTTLKATTKQAAGTSAKSTTSLALSITTNHEDSIHELAYMDDLVKDLKKLFGLTKAKPDGAFKSAGELYLYCVEQGWLGEDGSIIGPLRPALQENLAALAALTLNETDTKANSTKENEIGEIQTNDTRGRGKREDRAKEVQSTNTQSHGKREDRTEEPQPIAFRGRGKGVLEDIQTKGKYLLRGRGKKTNDSDETAGEVSKSTKGKKK